MILKGGANDISKHEVNTSLKHLGKFVNSRQSTNMMTVPAYHRHDLRETSRVNTETEVLNRKLHKVVKSADNVKIIQADVSRKDYLFNQL